MTSMEYAKLADRVPKFYSLRWAGALVCALKAAGLLADCPWYVGLVAVFWPPLITGTLGVLLHIVALYVAYREMNRGGPRG